MLRTLDRYILKGFLVNYLIAMGVMISLCIVLDLLMNLDEFTERGLPGGQVIANIGNYYGYQMFSYFSQLAGMIVVVAAAFTLARLQRNNELTAVLSAGVSLYRVAAPVIVAGILTNALVVLNNEVIVPHIADKLVRPRDDVQGTRSYGVWFVHDDAPRGRDGSLDTLLSAAQFRPGEERLYNLVIMQRDAQGELARVITALSAEWSDRRGGWTLQNGQSDLRPAGDQRRDLPSPRQAIDFFPTSLGPGQLMLRQTAIWANLLSIGQLRALAHRQADRRDRYMAIVHGRVTMPLNNMVMLLLALPFFLNREPGAVVRSAGKALLTCGGFFVLAFAAQQMAAASGMPALPAWTPTLLCGPGAIILLDGVKT